MPLGFELVQTLGLVLHELATNALKYGALKEPYGRLSVSWKVRKDVDVAVLVLAWRESGVPDLKAPSRKGFGSELIEKAMRYTLQAKTELTFSDDGVFCLIEVPTLAAGQAREDADVL